MGNDRTEKEIESARETLLHYSRFDNLLAIDGLSLLANLTPLPHDLTERIWDDSVVPHAGAFSIGVCDVWGNIIAEDGWDENFEFESSKKDKSVFYKEKYSLCKKWFDDLTRLFSYWDGNKNISALTPLSYYVEWAKKKRIPIAWESLAIELEIIEGPAHPRIAHAQSPWPWGTYSTKHLDVLSAAVQRYWVNYDPEDISTAPTNADIVEWLKSNHKLSENMAKAIASIIRADGLPTGPR